MQENMAQPVLTDPEWALLVELLEEEQRELAVEIRHTAVRAYKERLVERSKMVDSLMARLRAIAVPE
jgi:hypothetical protein